MAIFWSKVGVAMQSALATAVTIDAISKADPALVEYTDAGSSDPSNGDYVILDVQGMFQMDEKVVRVASVNTTTDDFQAEGIDSQLFDTFSSGTFQVITFGTTISTFTDITVSGGEPEFADITTIHDNVRRQAPTVTSPLVFSFESIFDATDTGLLALKQASDLNAQRSFRFTFSDNSVMVFQGYVSAPLVPVGSAQDVVKTNVTITANGTPTFYSS